MRTPSLETLDAKARDDLRRVLIRDKADPDAISSRLTRDEDLWMNAGALRARIRERGCRVLWTPWSPYLLVASPANEAARSAGVISWCRSCKDVAGP